MTTNISLRILSGFRKGQVETIPLAAKAQITLGRGPVNTVEFDAVADSTVSRQHARIIVDDTGSKFQLSDEESTHGTFLNGQKITGPTRLDLGDEIALGPQTKLIFDLDPRPEGYVAKTKTLKAIESSARKTAAIDLGAEVPPKAQTPTGVSMKEGRRSRTEPSRASKLTIIGAIAGASLVVLISFGAYYYHYRIAQETPKIRVAEQTELTTQNIAERYSKSTLFVGVKWRLFDRESGKPIYQKYMPYGQSKVGLYVTLKDQGVVPWLTTDDDNGFNEPIGFEGSGSGFVISSDGQILTNKHVAAGWKVAYGDLPDVGYVVWPGITIAQITQIVSKERPMDLSKTPAGHQLDRWIPGNGGVLFESNRSVQVGAKPREFDGRNEELFVEFPGSTLRG